MYVLAIHSILCLLNREISKKREKKFNERQKVNKKRNVFLCGEQLLRKEDTAFKRQNNNI